MAKNLSRIVVHRQYEIIYHDDVDKEKKHYYWFEFDGFFQASIAFYVLYMNVYCQFMFKLGRISDQKIYTWLKITDVGGTYIYLKRLCKL